MGAVKNLVPRQGSTLVTPGGQIGDVLRVRGSWARVRWLTGALAWVRWKGIACSQAIARPTLRQTAGSRQQRRRGLQKRIRRTRRPRNGLLRRLLLATPVMSTLMALVRPKA